MREASIISSNGYVIRIDDCDLGLLSKHRWHVAATHKGNVTKCYALRASGGKTTYLHREVMRAKSGDIVDHINGDTLDNRRCNLRIVDKSVNVINRGVSNKTGFRGVHENREGKFRAMVQIGGKRFGSGYFGSAREAAEAYDRLAIEHHGAFAILNFSQERQA